MVPQPQQINNNIWWTISGGHAPWYDVIGACFDHVVNEGCDNLSHTLVVVACNVPHLSPHPTPKKSLLLLYLEFSNVFDLITCGTSILYLVDHQWQHRLTPHCCLSQVHVCICVCAHHSFLFFSRSTHRGFNPQHHHQADQKTPDQNSKANLPSSKKKQTSMSLCYVVHENISYPGALATDCPCRSPHITCRLYNTTDNFQVVSSINRGCATVYGTILL